MANGLKLLRSIISPSWEPHLDPFFITKEMGNIFTTINNEAKGGKVIYPSFDNLFRAFNLCPYDDLKVVILGKEPYNNGDATGLAFGIKDSDENMYEAYSPELYKITECIESSIYEGFHFFDYSLEELPRQGVLLLNAALTTQANTINPHLRLWLPFTQYVMNYISTHKEGIIFCLWGKEAQYYSKFIDESKHTILKYEHPAMAANMKQDWNCDHFWKINELLTEKINW